MCKQGICVQASVDSVCPEVNVAIGLWKASRCRS